MPQINDLPNEILLKILLYLPRGSLDDLYHNYIPVIARVSKSWHEAVFELYVKYLCDYLKRFAANDPGEIDRECLYRCFKSTLQSWKRRSGLYRSA